MRANVQHLCSKPGCRLHEWRRGLCYTHWREAHGWIFDAVRKVFVRTK